MALPQCTASFISNDSVHDEVFMESKLLENIICAAKMISENVCDELVFDVLREMRQNTRKSTSVCANKLHACVL